MAKSRVTGKMQRNWLSKIGKSNKVTNVVEEARVRTKTVAEAKVNAQGYDTGPGYYHYGARKASTGQQTKWSATGLIWCESPMARKQVELLDTAADTVDLRLKKKR